MSEQTTQQDATTTSTAAATRDELRTLPLSTLRVEDGFNPRTEVPRDEHFAALVATIRERGVLQPIRVRPDDDGSYIVIAGHRRYLACVEASVMELPCLIATGTQDDAERLVDALIENDVRADLDPLDRARAYARLKARGLTVRGIAERLQTKPARVSEHLAVLTLPEAVQQAVAARDVPLHAVKALTRLVKIEPALAELARLRVAASAAQTDELYEPVTWADVARDPIAICCSRFAELGGQLPAGVWDTDDPIALEDLQLPAKATRQLDELRQLTDHPQSHLRLDGAAAEQADALGALHKAEGHGALLVGADVAAQLATDAIAAALKHAKQTANDRAAAQVDPAAAVAGGDQHAAAHEEAERQEAAKRQRAEQLEQRAAAEAFNDRLGAALLNHLAKVKVDARTLRLLLAVPVGPDLQAIAARGARLGLPGWVSETTTRGEKTKRVYLQPADAAAKARELLDGAKTPGDHAGRALVLLAMAVFADENALAMSNRAYYKPQPTGTPWAEQWEADLDALLLDQLPAGILDAQITRRAEQREEAAIRKADQQAAHDRVQRAIADPTKLNEDDLELRLSDVDAAYRSYSIEHMKATRILRDALTERRAKASDHATESAAE